VRALALPLGALPVAFQAHPLLRDLFASGPARAA